MPLLGLAQTIRCTDQQQFMSVGKYLAPHFITHSCAADQTELIIKVVDLVPGWLSIKHISGHGRFVCCKNRSASQEQVVSLISGQVDTGTGVSASVGIVHKR